MVAFAKKSPALTSEDYNDGNVREVSAEFSTKGIFLTVGQETDLIFPKTRLISRIFEHGPLRRDFQSRLNGLCHPTSGSFFQTKVKLLSFLFLQEISKTLALYFQESEYFQVVDAYQWLQAAIIHHNQSYKAALTKNERQIYTGEITLFGALNRLMSSSVDGQIYRDRIDQKESARDFLIRVYARKLKDDAVTLSDLRQLDLSLWQALRNQDRKKDFDLDILLLRGRSSPGRSKGLPKVAGSGRKAGTKNRNTPPETPENLAVSEQKKRDQARERMRRMRAKREPSPS